MCCTLLPVGRPSQYQLLRLQCTQKDDAYHIPVRVRHVLTPQRINRKCGVAGNEGTEPALEARHGEAIVQPEL